MKQREQSIQKQATELTWFPLGLCSEVEGPQPGWTGANFREIAPTPPPELRPHRYCVLETASAPASQATERQSPTQSPDHSPARPLD